MDGDRLLVNYTVDESAFQARPNVKGGRWRDRLKAKKSLYRGPRKTKVLETDNAHNATANEPSDVEHDFQATRPTKRAKVNSSADLKSRAISSHNEVISSLFTSNPAVTSGPASVRHSLEADVAPSNAPLPEDAHNFTALGVNGTLAVHLSTGLHLKAPTAIQEAAIPHLLKNETDALVQAETGSGKTLAYLLPIVQHLTSLRAKGQDSKINRKSGVFALILAPTRELAKQIDETLTSLLKKVPWLVHGTVYGGTTKNHEKARIRKGINILVATPGRLSDHLENTEALDLGSVRWLVLDEGDRLVELGFEDDVRKLVERLDQPSRRKRSHVTKSDVENNSAHEAGRDETIWELPKRRTTILCSATMKREVQNLGGTDLNNAKLIKAGPKASLPDVRTESKSGAEEESSGLGQASKQPAEQSSQTFLAPAQLKQSFLTVPSKQRLVALHALLKRSFARKGTIKKVIVFLSCADSVDFQFEVFSRVQADEDEIESTKSRLRNTKAPDSAGSAPQASSQDPSPASKSLKLMQRLSELPTTRPSPDLSSPANPQIHLFKLHGSLPQQTRSATLSAFSKVPDPTVLFCTDVASRGLDLPDIDLVIEYDPPFSSDDHLHRVGRTARAGREGQAICFLMPGPEEGYVDILRSAAGERIIKGESAEDVLRKSFQLVRKPDEGRSRRWDELATDWQLNVERWVVGNSKISEMAKKAFVSHVRAYATHVAKERNMFDVKELHLGHLAKAFALREKPGGMNHQARGAGASKDGKARKAKIERPGNNIERLGRPREPKSVGKANAENIKPDWRGEDTGIAPDGQTNARKMKEKMKEHMASAGEFNIG